LPSLLLVCTAKSVFNVLSWGAISYGWILQKLFVKINQGYILSEIFQKNAPLNPMPDVFNWIYTV